MRSLALLMLVPTTIAAADDPFGPAPVVDERPAERPTTLRVQFDLVDGSRVIGEPSEGSRSIRLRSHVGTFEVPFAKLVRVEVAADRETTILHWPNGDRLTGFVDGEGVEIATVLGKVTVPLPAISSCTVLTNQVANDVPK